MSVREIRLHMLMRLCADGEGVLDRQVAEMVLLWIIPHIIRILHDTEADWRAE
jgi:hypothetical protein